jgi:hypothetical protein
LLAEDIWLRELDKQQGNIVITDARFPNELDKVIEKGGQLVHITRKDHGPINEHISEVAHLSYTDDTRWHIHNSGTLEEYRTNIRRIVESVLQYKA